MARLKRCSLWLLAISFGINLFLAGALLGRDVRWRASESYTVLEQNVSEQTAKQYKAYRQQQMKQMRDHRKAMRAAHLALLQELAAPELDEAAFWQQYTALESQRQQAMRGHFEALLAHVRPLSATERAHVVRAMTRHYQPK